MTDLGKDALNAALDQLDQDWGDWDDRENQVSPEGSFKTPAPIKKFIATLRSIQSVEERDRQMTNEILLEARDQMERLAAIIEGRDERARLLPPHGQTSAAPRRVMERIDNLLQKG